MPALPSASVLFSWLKTVGSRRAFLARRALSSGVVADDEVEFAEAGGKDPFCTSEVNDVFFPVGHRLWLCPEATWL